MYEFVESVGLPGLAAIITALGAAAGLVLGKWWRHSAERERAGIDWRAKEHELLVADRAYFRKEMLAEQSRQRHEINNYAQIYRSLEREHAKCLDRIADLGRRVAELERKP